MKKKLFLLILMFGLGGLLITACAHQIKKVNQTTSKKSTLVKKKGKNDRLTQIVNQMSLNQKIGQLYFAHSTGNFEQMKADINKYHLGGITLFAPDYQNRTQQQFLEQMKQYQKASLHGLFIATDQEGGTVSRLNTNPQICKRNFPSPQEIYQKHGLTGIKQEDAQVASLLKANNINMNFAPVADVAQDHRSFIYPRTLGQNYIKTAQYIRIATQAIQDQGVAACLKHFPGYGDAGDTHLGFAEINKPLATYEKEDLLPFSAGIDAGASSVMVTHIVIKNLDPNLPASLSPTVHQLLRKQLYFQGLIITDDLQMGAITQFAKKRHTNADLLALKAGNDLLLGGDYRTGIPLIKKAVQKGVISEKQLDQSVRRILLLKEKLSILK